VGALRAGLERIAKTSRKFAPLQGFFGLFQGRLWYNSPVDFQARAAFRTRAFSILKNRETSEWRNLPVK
jgi:hypothetical protein